MVFKTGIVSKYLDAQMLLSEMRFEQEGLGVGEQPPDDTIYVVRTTDRFGQWKSVYYSTSGQRAGFIYLHSDFNHQTSNQLYRIDNLAKHEAGHSFGIGNGLSFDPPSAYSQNSFTGLGNTLVITS